MNPNEVQEKKAKDVVHYVNIIESFKHLVQDSSFVTMEEKNIIPGNDSLLRDVKDGELYSDRDQSEDSRVHQGLQEGLQVYEGGGGQGEVELGQGGQDQGGEDREVQS